MTTSVTDTNLTNNQDTESTTVSKAPTTPKAPKVKKPKKVKGAGLRARQTITGTDGNDTLVGRPAST